jgi:hypothetical protein
MTGKTWMLIAAAASAGFLGGALANGVNTALAQPRSAPAQEITAQRFVVTDAGGNKRAEMGLDAEGRIHLSLYSEKGRVLWSAPMPGLMPLSSTQ